jgi:alpha/beta superfamily hydrolase
LVSAGWSFGSVVALHAALGQPRVAAAVAIAPPFGRSASPDPPAPERMRDWDRPVLVVAGERDDISPVDAMRPWVAGANAELSVVPGADHFFRQPELVADEMLAFLRRHGVG